jgi:hypothetical protein
MSELHKRTFDFKTRAIDEEKRTVELAFSSETPVERTFGFEVLDHSEGSVDLQRLNGGAALLVNHNLDDQVGVVESARVDDDKVGRATVRFGNSVMFKMAYADWFRWVITSSTQFGVRQRMVWIPSKPHTGCPSRFR